MHTTQPVRPAVASIKPLSALLSQSNDDFYGQLQAIMNAIPAALTPAPVVAVGLMVSDDKQG